MRRYGHITVDCTISFKIVLINGVLTVALKSESAISSEITLVIMEFSVSPAIAAVVPTTPVLPLLWLYAGSTFPSTACCCSLFFPSYRGLL